jgi:hypothetical protein
MPLSLSGKKVRVHFYLEGEDNSLPIWWGWYDVKMSDAWIRASARIEARERGTELPREISVVREL